MESKPFNFNKSFGFTTPCNTALTTTADNAALGVGDIILIYGNIVIHIIAVIKHANWDVVPVIRDTNERLMDPETGALPTTEADKQLTPCAINSRGASHFISFSFSNVDAIPTICKKLTPANKHEDIINKM